MSKKRMKWTEMKSLLSTNIGFCRLVGLEIINLLNDNLQTGYSRILHF